MLRTPWLTMTSDCHGAAPVQEPAPAVVLVVTLVLTGVVEVTGVPVVVAAIPVPVSAAFTET